MGLFNRKKKEKVVYEHLPSSQELVPNDDPMVQKKSHDHQVVGGDQDKGKELDDEIYEINVNDMSTFVVPRLITSVPADDALVYKVVNVSIGGTPQNDICAMLSCQVPRDARVIGDDGVVTWHRDGFQEGKKYITDRMQVLSYVFIGDQKSVLGAMANQFRDPKSVELVSFADHKTKWELGKWTRVNGSNKNLVMCKFGLHFCSTPSATKTYYWDYMNNIHSNKNKIVMSCTYTQNNQDRLGNNNNTSAAKKEVDISSSSTWNVGQINTWLCSGGDRDKYRESEEKTN